MKKLSKARANGTVALVQDDMNKFNVLFMASSKNVGLTFNLTHLAVALKKIGNEVIVVSEPKEEEKGLFKELIREGVKCYAICGIDNFSIRKTISAAKKIGKIIENDDVDIVHAQGIRHMLVASIASRVFCHNKKIGIVVSIHTTLHGRPYENLAPLVESFLLNMCADTAIPVAKSVANKLVNSGLFPNKVAVVHNGINLELCEMIMCDDEYLSSVPHDFRSSSRIIVGYCAKMVPHKGHKYLMKAISEVAKKFSDIRLVITSNGPLREKLKILSENFGIEKKVHFTGRIEYRYLYQLLKRIDIYAFPSLAELFPFAILEAMAAGKPIVATNVGGVPEAVIDGVNGYMVPPRDPTSLAKAILRLINDPDKAREMGLKGRRLVEQRFSMDVITRKLNDVYELALKRKINA